MNNQSASQSAICAVECAQLHFQEHCAALMEILTAGPIELGPGETKQVDLAALDAARKMRPVIVNQPARASEAKPSIAEQHRKRACDIAMAGMWPDYPRLLWSTLKKYLIYGVARISGNVPRVRRISV